MKLVCEYETDENNVLTLISETKKFDKFLHRGKYFMRLTNCPTYKNIDVCACYCFDDNTEHELRLDKSCTVVFENVKIELDEEEKKEELKKIEMKQRRLIEEERSLINGIKLIRR